MKKLFLTLLTVLMATTVTGCTKEPTDDKDVGGGDQAMEEAYEITANGYGGEMRIRVTFTGDELTNIEVVEHNETEEIGAKAINEVITKILDAKSTEIEAVSGATMTTNAIIEAVNEATEMKNEIIEPIEDTVYVPTTFTELALDYALADGEYPYFTYLGAEDLATLTTIDTENVNDFVFAMPSMNVHATTFVIVEAKDEAELSTITEKMNTYFTGLEDQWSNYLPDQYELVQNRVEKTVGNFYIGVVANDAETLVSSIETYLTTPAK